METTIKASNREIAIRAFDHLRQERKTDSALRLAHHLLHYDRISLGIGEVDWEIDMAIRKFGGSPRTGYRIRHISVSRVKRRWRKRDTKRYSTVKSNRRAATRSLFTFIDICTGNRILPYTGNDK